MLGKRSADPGLMEADHPYLDHVGRNSFYGLLATQRDHLFQDEDFAALYCLNNGRPSVPPSLLATALLLQSYDRVSDEEAKARADFDLRWKVALGVGLEERPFAKSTLQCFRAQLILHDLMRYFGSSLKGEATIDWDDPGAREAFLRAVVADADRLLEVTRHTFAGLLSDDPEQGQLRQAAALLQQLLVQDIERRPDGAVLRDGVSPDRVVAVHDPEMRHGRKSATKRFDGHKAVIAVDPDSQLITVAQVLPGNAHDHEQALEVVAQAEANTKVTVEETIGDGAFGDSDTRQAFAMASRTLVAKAPQRRGQAQFPKEDFQIDLEAMTCVCPAGHVCRTVVSISSAARYGAPGTALRTFRFDAERCDACPLRLSCVRARPGRGRLGMLHPQEALLQAARAFQRSPAFSPYRRLRQVAEHRLARLMQLGVRQARYVGRAKTRCQLLLAATVANLTLVATRVGLMPDRRREPVHEAAPIFALFMSVMVTRHLTLAPMLAGKSWTPTRGEVFGRTSRACYALEDGYGSLKA